MVATSAKWRGRAGCVLLAVFVLPVVVCACHTNVEGPDVAKIKLMRGTLPLWGIQAVDGKMTLPGSKDTVSVRPGKHRIKVTVGDSNLEFAVDVPSPGNYLLHIVEVADHKVAHYVEKVD